MTPLRLSVAIGEYDRTQQLLNGAVSIDGVDPIFMVLEPEEIFFRAFRHADFDICEMSLSSYVLQTLRGTCAYVGIPVFPSRAFRHTSIYIRTDRIKSPGDLHGRRVGVPEYQLTANVWARALLEDDFGVAPHEITWVRGGIEEASRPEKIELNLGDGIRIESAREGASLSELLRSGEIDAMIAPRAPSCFDQNCPNVGWLFTDPAASAADYFQRTGIFPIMHLVGLRKALVEQYPFLPTAVFKAFERARSIALGRLAESAALRVSLPFLETDVRTAINTMGKDYWSYGAEENRNVLKTFLKHHHRQGLSSRELSIDELFHPSTYEQVKI